MRVNRTPIYTRNGGNSMNEKDLYDASYFIKRKDARRESAYLQDSQKILSRINPTSILDIGGGHGEFGTFFECDYFCYDPYALENELPDAYFDVVVFRGTLQHLFDPVVMLQKAKGLLTKGGLLAILATPNTDSVGYIRWGTLPALDPPRNWIWFGHKELRNVLEKLDFRKIEISFPYEKPYARPLINFWNFIIGKPDAFPGNMMECFARKD